MSDTPARLLSLLSLLQTAREWPGNELAQRLRVSDRTIRRDIERLRDLGYPVEATMGPAGGYGLVAGAAMPPLLLDDEEAVAIGVGLRGAAGQAVEGIEEASLRALSKLERVLPARLRHRVRALNAATVPLAGEQPMVDPENLTVIAAAVAVNERLRFGYRAGDGTDSERLVEPHRLVTAGHRWYFLAFDNDRNDWRIFRADRITGLRPTGTRTAPRPLPGGDASAYVLGKLYDLAPTYQAVATRHTPAADVAARFGDSLGELEPLGPTSCRLRSRTGTLEWLGFRLAMLGCEFEVHEPPELSEYLRALGARVTRGAGGDH